MCSLAKVFFRYVFKWIKFQIICSQLEILDSQVSEKESFLKRLKTLQAQREFSRIRKHVYFTFFDSSFFSHALVISKQRRTARHSATVYFAPHRREQGDHFPADQIEAQQCENYDWRQNERFFFIIYFCDSLSWLASATEGYFQGISLFSLRWKQDQSEHSDCIELSARHFGDIPEQIATEQFRSRTSRRLYWLSDSVWKLMDWSWVGDFSHQLGRHTMREKSQKRPSARAAARTIHQRRSAASRFCEWVTNRRRIWRRNRLERALRRQQQQPTRTTPPENQIRSNCNRTPHCCLPLRRLSLPLPIPNNSRLIQLRNQSVKRQRTISQKCTLSEWGIWSLCLPVKEICMSIIKNRKRYVFWLFLAFCLMS